MPAAHETCWSHFAMGGKSYGPWAPTTQHQISVGWFMSPILSCLPLGVSTQQIKLQNQFSHHPAELFTSNVVWWHSGRVREQSPLEDGRGWACRRAVLGGCCAQASQAELRMLTVTETTHLNPVLPAGKVLPNLQHLKCTPLRCGLIAHPEAFEWSASHLLSIP